MISIILIEPETPGNIGAVARVMANFRFKDLVLINPKCNHLDEEAQKRAKHGLTVLKKSKIKDGKFLKKFHTLAATTAKLGTDYNISRSPVTPEEFSKLIDSKQKTGIVFGRESDGLTNEEIMNCDFVLTIPSSKEYPTLNLSHSVAIVLYELSKSKENIKSHITPSSINEKKQIWKLFSEVMNKISFATPSKKETQKKIWKKIFGKSYLSKREAYAIMGLFKKISEKLKRKNS